MAPPRFHLAIDLGAASGRAVLGALGANGLELHEVTGSRRAAPRARNTCAGMRRVSSKASAPSLGLARATAADMEVDVISAGVDSWGIDYGLVDGRGQLVEDPVCYRDERTSDDLLARVFARVPREELFARTASSSCRSTPCSSSPHTSVRACRPRPQRLLLIPDLCHHLLCGSLVTRDHQRLHHPAPGRRHGDWDDELFARLGLPRALMPESCRRARSSERCARGCIARAGSMPSRSSRPRPTIRPAPCVGTPLEPGWRLHLVRNLVARRRRARRRRCWTKRPRGPISPTKAVRSGRCVSSRT